MKILISGAGIGGLTLAYWLNYYGFETVIFEKAPEFKRRGYLIGIRETGLNILEKMGVRSTLQQYDIPIRDSRWLDRYGKIIRQVSYQKLKDFSDFLMLNRADLHQCLLELVQDQVDLRFNCIINHLEQDELNVYVTNNNNYTEKFDLVIGCDGFNSLTRKLVFGDDYKQFMGAAYFAFAIENRLQNSCIDRYTNIDLRGFGNYASCGIYSTLADEIGGYFIYKTDKFTDISKSDRQTFLRERFAHYSPFYRELIDSIQPQDYLYHDELTQIAIPTWTKGRIALLGDAAYCMTLMSGMGASMAMAGAYVLAQQIDQYQSQPQGYQLAFQAYEHTLRDKITQLQEYGRNISNFTTANNLFGYNMTNLFLKIIPEPILMKQLAKMSATDFDFDSSKKTLRNHFQE
jgi:2-polyprenyl-6-methoxyphenol hydroxylase-like FAD-dependent oxidoreductase